MKTIVAPMKPILTMHKSNMMRAYLDAKVRVVEAGYGNDIDWAEGLAHVKHTPQSILSEGAWVIVNSGFRYAVARKLWPAMLEAFYDFRPKMVSALCYERAIRVLAHKGKIHGILDLAREIQKDHGARIIIDAVDPPKLIRLNFIGKITCWHYAKVLGVDCVKPDVHLVRAANAAGYNSPLALCKEIRELTGDRLTVVDSVLWRYGEQQNKRGWRSFADIFNGAST